MIIRSVKEVDGKTTVTLAHEGEKMQVGRVLMKWLTYKGLDGQKIDFAVRHITYEPGCVVPTHSHAHCHAVYILRGKLEVSSPTETRILGPDTLYYVPPFEPHASKNAGDEPATILSCINCIGEGDNCIP